jgi:hypothetical protein
MARIGCRHRTIWKTDDGQNQQMMSHFERNVIVPVGLIVLIAPGRTLSRIEIRRRVYDALVEHRHHHCCSVFRNTWSEVMRSKAWCDSRRGLRVYASQSKGRALIQVPRTRDIV